MPIPQAGPGLSHTSMHVIDSTADSFIPQFKWMQSANRFIPGAVLSGLNRYTQQHLSVCPWKGDCLCAEECLCITHSSCVYVESTTWLSGTRKITSCILWCSLFSIYEECKDVKHKYTCPHKQMSTQKCGHLRWHAIKNTYNMHRASTSHMHTSLYIGTYESVACLADIVDIVIIKSVYCILYIQFYVFGKQHANHDCWYLVK